MTSRTPRVANMLGLVVAALLTLQQPSHALGFLAPQSIPLGNSTPFSHAIAVGDLNHDGRPDLVVADWVSNVVDVVLALPGGGYDAVVRYPAASAPYSLELVDMNGDTHLDAVTGNRSGASVSVYLGDGSGGFQPRIDYAAPAEVSVATVGDVTGDGLLDVVAAADLRVCVFAGNGAGQLAPPTSTVLGTSLESSQVWGIALGDLDGDADLDVVTNYRGPLVQLRNDGSGGFTRFDFGGTIGARALAVTDVTSDGLPDVIAASEFQNGVVVFAGNGTGSLTQLPVIGSGLVPWGLAFGDLDGNGELDAVTPNIASNTVAILLGTGSGLGVANPILSAALNPISVDVADLNGDGFQDVVATGYSGTIEIWLQLPGGGAGSSQTTLAAEPSVAVFGQPVTLTATVTPSSATGAVTFTDGASPLGQVPVAAGGVAQLVVQSLTGGIHSITASYSGDADLAPSAASPIQVEVTPAPTTTAITTSANPSAAGTNIVIEATVQATPPTPVIGFVIFRLDGALWRNVQVDPATGIAVTAVSDLPLGLHTLQASFEGTPNHLSSVSPILEQSVVGPEPDIVSVRDVPNDQGGRVTIKWDSPADAPQNGLITGYRIWRRAAADGIEGSQFGAGESRFARLQPPGAAQVDYWEALAELPAEGLVHYAYTAATTQDSLPGGNPYTAFFVSALTANPAVFFHSPVDSGYSVDNLAPPAPAPFAVVYQPGGNDLHWTPRRTPDLREYRIHRGGLVDFVPGPGNLFAVTRDSTLHDPSAGSFVYKLAAIDVHGNASRYLVVTPDSPVGTLASLSGLEVLGDRIRLRWYSGDGAGSAATLYRRELTTPWEELARLAFDGTGHLVYEDTRIEPGRRYGYRLGILNGDQEDFTAEAWTNGLAPPSLAMAIVSPNPSPTGRVAVVFSLPKPGAARLEMLDVTGRRVVARDLTSLGPGRHTLTLDESAGAPAGVYLLHLSQGATSATSRVVVLP